MITKKAARLKRAKRTRVRIKRAEAVRVCIYKTPRHMYAQVTSSDGAKTLAAASTLDAEVKGKVKYTGNVEAAKAVGRLLAERALKLGIENVAFDRSGFLYHGRVKALADAARESGLKF